MATYKLAVIVKRSYFDEDEFLLAKQTPPPMPAGEGYQNYRDSDLWDVPSAPLELSEGKRRSEVVVRAARPDILDLGRFDVGAALEQALSQVGLATESCEDWEFWKYEEEAEFGPGPPVHTVFILGALKSDDVKLQGRWVSIKHSLKLLFEVRPSDDRIGPLYVMGLISNSVTDSKKWRVPLRLCSQEYPPGVRIIPMRSRTTPPFCTTNLVVVAPNNVPDDINDFKSTIYGDSLLVDPGCFSEHHSDLGNIVTSLERRLVVLVTHHHCDHIDGLSVVHKCNPDAILVAHENTMARIGKDKWPCRYVPVSGGEEICIGGQKLEVIFAPGHTDGHTALHHKSTNSLIVGDHCVGKGSAFLDVTSGGNMKDYFQTTYNFMDRSPHVIIPMHGRYNLWPKQMLCGYLKHRRDREMSILKAIENGAKSLFDVVSTSYADVDTKLWIHAASNVQIHVDHLSYQGKLPEEFSMRKFRATCGLRFLCRWAWWYLKCRVPHQKLASVGLLSFIGIAGVTTLWAAIGNRKLIA